MDESKIELPAWLPWATTACLAALVACLGELWMIERTRTQLLRDRSLLDDAALQGAENQIEAERIVGDRALEQMRLASAPAAGLRVILLLPPGDMPAKEPGPPAAALVLDAEGKRGLIRLSGASDGDRGREYRLWLEGPGTDYPADCGVFRAAATDAGSAMPLELAAPIEPGCRFVLVGADGEGSRAPRVEGAAGPIVLASPPFTGRISGR